MRVHFEDNIIHFEDIPPEMTTEQLKRAVQAAIAHANEVTGQNIEIVAMRGSMPSGTTEADSEPQDGSQEAREA